MENGWKSSGIKRNSGIITTTYIKMKKREVTESFAEIEMAREKNKTVNDEVNEMIARMEKDFTKNGCINGGLTIMPQSTNKFNAWNEIIDCKKDKVNIMLFFVSPDPKSIYLFIYTNDKRPFTNAVKEESLKSIKSTIKICYQFGDCYPLE